ncbi:RNA polymerase sigma-54 factor [Aestuariivirga litoralis]|uniref:RNA polymerase sigma-54 factor n=1 Tax=Aestuariivirga litoralis TaxID=2650924 RepID=A0A2W2BKA8_9HYPH|nr:RNA polymerase factor sigma-54 [Aestuariivirga litoralis]PZF76649.1 RNA polymerase sigma-54 factor [Aestuariivirga litoralis]
MALNQRLDLRQGQSLVMTPQLQQAIKLLQMSNLELQAYVDQELERNPLLERDERAEIQKPAEAPESQPDMVAALASTSAAEDRLRTLDTELENVYTHESRADAASREAAVPPPDSGWSSLRPQGALSLDAEGLDFDATLTRQPTLAEHLTDQMHLLLTGPADQLIGQHLIGSLNEAGYLIADIPAMAEALGTSAAHVEAVLAMLQSCDPPGVFARDLRECLTLQLKERDRFDPAMAALVAHLDLVAKRDYAALRTICRVDLEDLKDMVAELRALDPKPGHAFGSDPVQPVIPDVLVRPSPEGAWVVELNTDTLPRVLINNQYLARVSATAQRSEDKVYLSECQANASWLVKSLDQRAKTILKVAREIVRQQDAFLLLGIQHLRPLNLRTVADAIEMHESTVSRVTSNKYMATPRGIFELKYFFTTAIASADGEGDAHSAEAVRHRIRELIAAEGQDVLSDDTIVDRLKASGIDIARRTVAKYRESLGIPSSVQRRREARVQAAQ